MRLKPSPIRKSPAPLRGALRALVVSACALTVPTFPAQASQRRPYHPTITSPASLPYLAILSPTALRFAVLDRPPAELVIEPLPDELTPDDAVSTDPTQSTLRPGSPGASGNIASNDPLAPSPDSIDPSDPTQNTDPSADPSAVKTTVTKPAGPPPIMLSDDNLPTVRPEDILPYFRLPANPSSATYRKQ